MATVSNPGTGSEPKIEAAAIIDVVEPAPPALSKWYQLRHDGAALIEYLLDSEVHTFAFSVAANAILSFVPFVILLYTLSDHVFKSEAMTGVVNDMVTSFFRRFPRRLTGW